jgi:hypothetical protein
MCQKEMIPDTKPKQFDYVCAECNIIFYSKEILRAHKRWLTQNEKIQQVNLQLDTDYYYFKEHQKFYTVSEMERICRLKAFL